MGYRITLIAICTLIIASGCDSSSQSEHNRTANGMAKLDDLLKVVLPINPSRNKLHELESQELQAIQE